MTTNPTSAERSVESVADELIDNEKSLILMFGVAPSKPTKRGYSRQLMKLVYRDQKSGRPGLLKLHSPNGAFHSEYSLTPLGLAVRAHLIASEKKGC